MTREEFINLAKSWGYGYGDEEIADILSQLSDEELFPGAGISVREDTLKMDGFSTEEEWLDYYAENWLMHYRYKPT